VDSDQQNIPINIQFDDVNFPATSLATTAPFLESPPASQGWPNYNIFPAASELQIKVFNAGPEGIWLTYPGTRLILTTEDRTRSYGAMPLEIDAGNGFEPISTSRDSRYVLDNGFVTVKFNRLSNPPIDPPGAGDDIVPGEYLAFVWLNGYDSDGGAFIRTMDLGTVEIIP